MSDYPGRVGKHGAVDMLWALRRAQQAYWSEISADLERAALHDLPVRRIWMLEAIAEDARSPSALANRMGVSRQAVTQSVDALVQQGYVERTSSETDRRRVTLALSTRGRQAVTVARRASARVHARLRRRLGDDRIAEFMETLTELR
jgi:DNA-binding MarR family transcriptional regulator